MRSLELFNAVLSKDIKAKEPFVSTDGYIIAPDALWAKEEINNFWNQNKLNSLNG